MISIARLVTRCRLFLCSVRQTLQHPMCQGLMSHDVTSHIR
uniref:Uncharacterized protein n=1 Tax=Rhizophora mucronata TaxID=61149 RepID=A0A2P2LRA2_RHIMU